jgi:putative transposase
VGREIRLSMIESSSITISLNKQLSLIGIPKSSYYYKCHKTGRDKNCYIKEDILSVFKKEPTFGYRRMKIKMRNEYGWKTIGDKRIKRCMKELNIKAIYPRRKINTSVADKTHKKYPYLLKKLKIDHSNQAWASDITYTAVKGCRAYVVAIEDLYSRKILSWNVSNTMDVYFCIEALENALKRNGTPDIFNTDQGSQFTSEKFTSVLKNNNIKISMDSKGRALDNALMERVWRSLKYENIYLNDYQTVAELRKGVNKYFMSYNSARPHQSLAYEVPNRIYAEGLDNNKIKT